MEDIQPELDEARPTTESRIRRELMLSQDMSNQSTLGMSRQNSSKTMKRNVSNDLHPRTKPANIRSKNTAAPAQLKSSKSNLKQKTVVQPAGGRLLGQKGYFSPPPLFQEPQAENIEAMMIENLRQKMHEFNEELSGEMATNSRLQQQCKDYADKLTSINSQFESYRLKQESKLESMAERQESLKESLQEEKELRAASEREVRQLRSDLEALRQKEGLLSKQHDEALRQEREKLKDLKDDMKYFEVTQGTEG